MKCRVLYVDDDAPNLVVFEAACGTDFEVLTAESGTEALEIMRRQEVAILLTDQRMPGTSGVELAATVRDEFPETIRLLITAYADLDSAIDAINWGQVHKYLRKPWDIRELKQTLFESCELHRLNREMTDLRRRLLETERVYAIGVVAASIGRELTRPIGHLTEALSSARQSVASASASLAGKAPDPRQARARIDAADGDLASTQLFAGRILELLRGIDLPLRRPGDKTEKIALGEVIRLTLQVLRGEFRTRAQIKLDVKPVPFVEGSSASLGQVILNLLVNALQSFPPASRPENLVTLRMFVKDELVCVEVEDNGIAIPAESLARLFEPLVNREPGSGSRLGLAISKRIVEELGGRIEAEHPAAGGTRLRMLLPAAG
jgi:C4-dicarboxylate-specific signal transduction histidine kinase